MFVKMLVVVVLVAGVMVAIKDKSILRTTGLTAVCVVTQTATDGTQLEACRPGKLQGIPDLSGDGCRAAGSDGSTEYWRCPAPVADAPNAHN